MTLFGIDLYLASFIVFTAATELPDNVDIDGKKHEVRKRSYDGLLDRLVDVLVKERAEKHQLSGQLNEMKKELDTVSREIQQIQKQKNQKYFNYHKMIKDVDKAKSDIMDMKIKMMDFQTKENDSLSLVNVQTEMLRKIKSTSKKVMTNKKSIHNLEKLVGRIASSNKHKPIGFTYRLHPSNNLNYNGNEKIHFSLKIADYGGGYNVSDGIFYCQHSGLYLFTTSITTTTNGVWVYIMKNGQRIGYAYCEKSTSWASMSGSTVVSLNTGDRVWIQPHIRAHINAWSVFTGARISD